MGVSVGSLRRRLCRVFVVLSSSSSESSSASCIDLPFSFGGGKFGTTLHGDVCLASSGVSGSIHDACTRILLLLLLLLMNIIPLCDDISS